MSEKKNISCFLLVTLLKSNLNNIPKSQKLFNSLQCKLFIANFFITKNFLIEIIEIEGYHVIKIKKRVYVPLHCLIFDFLYNENSL